MNLVGNRAEKGPEPLQAAAPREPAGAGRPEQAPSPRDPGGALSGRGVCAAGRAAWSPCCGPRPICSPKCFPLLHRVWASQQPREGRALFSSPAFTVLLK